MPLEHHFSLNKLPLAESSGLVLTAHIQHIHLIPEHHISIMRADGIPVLFEPFKWTIRVYFLPICSTKHGVNRFQEQSPTEFRRSGKADTLKWKDLQFPLGLLPERDQRPKTLRDLGVCDGFYYLATLEHYQQIIDLDGLPEEWQSMVPPDTEEWKSAEVEMDKTLKLNNFGHGIGKLYFLGEDLRITACLPPVRTVPNSIITGSQRFSNLQSLRLWKETEPWDRLRKHVFTVDRNRIPLWGLCPCLQVPGSTVCESGKCYMAPFDRNHEFDGQDIAGKASQFAPGGWDLGLLWPPPPPPPASISSKAMVGVDGVLNLYLLWQDTKGIAYRNYL
jgi:hypothetical protein